LNERAVFTSIINNIKVIATDIETHFQLTNTQTIIDEDEDGDDVMPTGTRIVIFIFKMY
jgi:hypothetical protein